jgi:hypothetical protein
LRSATGSGACRRPARKIEFLLLLSLLVTYFSHVVTFMITLFVIGIQQLVVFRGKGTFRLVRVAAIPTALMIFYMLFGLTGDVVGFGLMWDPFWQRIAYLLMPLNVFTDTLDHSWVYQTQSVVSWIAFIAIAILGGSGKIRASLFSAALVAALLVLAMLSFPTMIALSSGSPRLAYPAAFALLALLPVGWDLRPVLRWIVAGICLMYPLLFGYRVAGFQKEMAGFEKVIEAIPRIKRSSRSSRI